MKYFITGGTGHIGSELVKYLVRLKHDVVILSRHYAYIPDVKHITGDLLDVQKYEHELEDAVVVHLAADVRVGVLNADERMELYRTNYIGTEELLDAFERNNGRQFVFLSSRQVYGTEYINEHTPLKGAGISVYAHSKILAHKAVRRRKLPWTILIPGMVYSSNEQNTGVNFIYRMFRRGLKVGFGLNTYTSFTFIDDLVRAIELVSMNDSAHNQEYIICNGGLTTFELYEIFHEVSGIGIPRRELPYWVLASLSSILSKITRVTGKKFLLNQETMNNAKLSTRMDNRKSKEFLGLNYYPLVPSLKRCIAEIGSMDAQTYSIHNIAGAIES